MTTTTQTRIIHCDDAPQDWETSAEYFPLVEEPLSAVAQVLQNPYWDHLGGYYGTETFEQGLERHRQYFLKRVEIDLIFRCFVLMLKGVTLVTEDHRPACHGDVVVEWLDQQHEEAAATANMLLPSEWLPVSPWTWTHKHFPYKRKRRSRKSAA